MKGQSGNEVRKKIQNYSYGLKDRIGKGIKPRVFRGLNDKTKQPVAIKVIDMKILSEQEKRKLGSELQVLKKLNHRNILKCFDIYYTENNCYIISEFCNEGDLEHLLKQRKKLTEVEAIPIFRDIVNAFRMIVEAGYLHRDLHPANILLKDKVAKITFFGFLKNIKNNHRGEVGRQNLYSEVPFYSSPQFIEENIYKIQSDIWSLGVIFYEILHGKLPWDQFKMKELIESMKKQTIAFSHTLSEDLIDFLKKCLKSDFSKRLGMMEFFNHPFIVRITANQDYQLNQKKHKKINNQILEKEKIRTQHEICSANNLKHNSSKAKSQKQFISQLNFMRFIFRYLQMLPEKEKDKNVLAFKFLVSKQLICQCKSLLKSLQFENTFGFEGWEQFLALPDKVKFYKQILKDYQVRYQKYTNSVKDWIIFGKKNKKISSFADLNFARSEALCISIIAAAIEECNQMWKQLKSLENQEENQKKFSKLAMKLDFTITLYQLNCLLVDNFYDPDYFARNSKIDIIIEVKPSNLNWSCLDEFEQKLRVLEMIK